MKNPFKKFQSSEGKRMNYEFDELFDKNITPQMVRICEHTDETRNAKYKKSRWMEKGCKKNSKTKEEHKT